MQKCDASEILRLHHCPVCKYDLRGAQDRFRCPECAYEYDESVISVEGQVAKSRLIAHLLRYRLITIGAFAAGGTLAAVAPGSNTAWLLVGTATGLLVGYAITLVLRTILPHAKFTQQIVVFSSTGLTVYNEDGFAGPVPWHRLKKLELVSTTSTTARLTIRVGPDVDPPPNTLTLQFGGSQLAHLYFPCTAKEREVLKNELTSRMPTTKR